MAKIFFSTILGQPGYMYQLPGQKAVGPYPSASVATVRAEAARKRGGNPKRLPRVKDF